MWKRFGFGSDIAMRHTKSILVVDDERPICDLLADLLDEEGYAVRRAYDGLTALDLADRYRPDLVLTDVMMPGLDGVALIHRLRERGIRSPVLLMSAVYADIDLPHVRFVPKPFDVDDILTVVRRTLRATTRPTARRGIARLWHRPRRLRHRQSRSRMQPIVSYR